MTMMNTATAAMRERVVLGVGAGVGGMILLAMAVGAANGRLHIGAERDVWLALHLVSVIPAIPVGAYVLLRRKGDRLHRMLGRAWAGMMMTAALSSFGLHGLTGGFSWIHLFSIVVSITVPRGIMQAMRHDIGAHRRTMTLTYLGLVGAGLFTLLPGRLIGSWLFG